MLKIDVGAGRVDFFSEHWYQINGIQDKLPSVSLINDTLSKGVGFHEWLKSVGHEADYIVREAQESGTRIHNTIEKLITGEMVEPVDSKGEFHKKEWQKVCDWFNWYNSLDFQPVTIEQVVYSLELGVAGTVDFVGYLDNELWLIDWKTGNDTYITADIQVAAYKKMWDEIFPLQKIQHIAVCHVGARNKTQKGMNNKGISVTEVDYEQNIRQFTRNVETFKFMNPGLKAPSDSFPMNLRLSKGTLDGKKALN